MSMSYNDIEKFDKLDKDIYKMLINKETTISKISKELGISRNALSRRLYEKFNYKSNPNGKKNIDSNFFSQPNNENMYWLGMILADGHLSKEGKFEITLKDYEHIEKFKNALKSEHRVCEKTVDGTKYYRLSFMDNQITKDLRKYGIVHNKSNISVDLPDVSKEHMNHFIRGYFDGDGSISKIKGNDKNVLVSLHFGLVNYNLANQFKSILDKNNVYLGFYKGHTTYFLQSTSKKSSLSFLKYIYKNSTISMDRKYELAKNVLPS